MDSYYTYMCMYDYVCVYMLLYIHLVLCNHILWQFRTKNGGFYQHNFRALILTWDPQLLLPQGNQAAHSHPAVWCFRHHKSGIFYQGSCSISNLESTLRIPPDVVAPQSQLGARNKMPQIARGSGQPQDFVDLKQPWNHGLVKKRHSFKKTRAMSNDKMGVKTGIFQKEGSPPPHTPRNISDETF